MVSAGFDAAAQCFFCTFFCTFFKIVQNFDADLMIFRVFEGNFQVFEENSQIFNAFFDFFKNVQNFEK